MYIVFFFFMCEHYKNVFKDHITYEHSINVTGKTFLHSFERTWPFLRTFTVSWDVLSFSV